LNRGKRGMSKIMSDPRLIIDIGKRLEHYFLEIESFLLSTSNNPFKCSIQDIKGKGLEQKLNKHFKENSKKYSNKNSSDGGIYFFHIETSDDFDAKQFISAWNKSKKKIKGNRPKANINFTGKCIDKTEQTKGYVLYVGSSLKIGSRIKEHFRNCKIAGSTWSLRLRCNPDECLKNIDEITVNYITFEGLHDGDKKAQPIHNLCRYFEAKLRQKHQALIGN